MRSLCESRLPQRERSGQASKKRMTEGDSESGAREGVQLTNTLTPTHFLKYGCNLQLELLREIGKVNGLE